MNHHQGGYSGGGGGGGDDYYNQQYGYGDQQQQQYNNYNDGYGDGVTNPYQQQQQQQQYYEEGKYPQEYYPNDIGNEGQYVEEQYIDNQQEQYGEYAENYGEHPQEQYDASAVADPNSAFYTAQPPFVAHPNGTPDSYGNYDSRGDPISAIAVDDNGGDATSNVPSLLYVASHTSDQGGGSRNSNHRGSLGRSRGGLFDKHPSLNRGSRLTVFYEDETNHASTGEGSAGFYGNRSMYSSFVAHPEASPKVLDELHSTIFGDGSTIVSKTYATTHGSIRPSHNSFGPAFGPPSFTHNSSLYTARAHHRHHHHHHHEEHGNQHRPEEKHCMGISSIFSVSTPYLGSGGRICTVSPHGVRVHTRGGMIMSDKSNDLLRGMTCGESSGRGSQFATVAGMSFPTVSGADDRRPQIRQQVHTIDLNRDLKIVSSHMLVRDGEKRSSSGGVGDMMCVTDMATNYERNNIVVGCSDGTIRVLDGGRRNAEVAKAKAQAGGVAKVAVSENLICASGYASSGVSSLSSPLPYPHPAMFVLLYDVRYLGRGGIPHMFAANRGGPRYVDFLPDGTLLVGSGQTFGGFEVMTPFDDEAASGGGHGSTFFQPELNAGESMTTVNVHEGELHIGTSYGRVLQYGLTNYDKTMHSTVSREQSGGSQNMLGMSGSTMNSSASGDSFRRGASGGSMVSSTTSAAREPLDMPPFIPSPPKLSIDPAVLCASSNDRLSSSSSVNDGPIQGWNVFDSYTMASNPLLSSDKALLHPRYSRSSVKNTTLGPLSSKALVAPSKRFLSKALQSKLDEEEKVSATRGSLGSQGGTNPADADFVKVFPTTDLIQNDLMEPTAESVEEGIDAQLTNRTGGGYQGKNFDSNKAMKKKRTFPNPNKFLYAGDTFPACYDATADPRKKYDQSAAGEEDLIEGEENGIPLRYRLTVRPPFYQAFNFDYAQYNDTGLYVGWDYAPTFANSFACSVLALLYFVGEIRETVLGLQLYARDLSIGVGNEDRRQKNLSVTAELGLLFNLIENLSANGMIQPETTAENTQRGQVKAFVPSSFIAAFASLPEATNLALVDGVAGAAEIARRPEAFYRFLMQYMERELGQLLSATSILPASETVSAIKQSQGPGHLIDRMQGMGFLSIIEYTHGKPKMSISRALTVDLAYDEKNTTDTTTSSSIVRFGEILRHSLCKEAPLRAWCDETRSYEAVIQRRIATGLPSLLSLSCCCAGRKADVRGLQFWQQECRNWLPEFIHIRIETDRSITVRELVTMDDGEEEWMTFCQRLELAEGFFDAWEEQLQQDLPLEKSYRLDAVVSFVRTHSGDVSSSQLQSTEGHHVVHVRTPIDLENKMLENQLCQVNKCLVEKEKSLDSTENAHNNDQFTLVSGISLHERKKHLEEQLSKVKERETSSGGGGDDQWLLLNGFNVTKLDNSDDARSFNAKFKEPSIVLFREINNSGNDCDKVPVAIKPSDELSSALYKSHLQDAVVPVSAMGTMSISNGCGPKLTISDLLNLPKKGDLVAIDAEFVCVQPEESLITSSGSKEIISEPRNALARLSIINCQTNEVIIDDYVLPQEPVVDYLTRFSGIRQSDLDANTSPHHLVSPQEAYLKVRLLMERGCIFVGHGLSQDFRVINICIPPNQIIDTAEIFHQPNQRYISLRYLTNYVLGRDMQQEVHDSIEDAKAAHDLYTKAVSLKKEGKFDDYLMSLYSHGHKTQFKLGVANK